MTRGPLAPSGNLFDALAPDYDEHFAAPHRSAYDDLAWERVAGLLPAPPALVIDVGCGTGRWAPRLVALGYGVVGIEPAQAMAECARRRAAALEPTGRFRVIEAPVEAAEVESESAGAVLAMGSLQYVDDTPAALARMVSWLRPGGVAAVLTDSLVALVVELMAAGRMEEALDRVATRRGVWRTAGAEADTRLFDANTLAGHLEAAGLTDVAVVGLLVTASTWGRQTLLDRLGQDRAGVLAIEWELGRQRVLADLGKQLLVTGRKPESSEAAGPPARPAPARGRRPPAGPR